MAAAITGVGILSLGFSSYWPATRWTVVPRANLIAAGRHFAGLFGLDVGDWKPYLAATVSKSRTPNPKGVPPLTVRITFVSKKGHRTADVGLDSSGLPLYWRPPEHNQPPDASASSEETAAAAAFRIMAGPQAEAYKDHSRSMGDDVREETYVWRMQPSPDSDLRDRIRVFMKGAAVESVERKVYLASSRDDDSDASDNGYWGVLSGIFGLLCTAAFLCVLAIYILWLARRATNHQFPVRLAGAALLLMSVAIFFGSNWEESHVVSENRELTIVPALFMAAAILGLVAVGRGISMNARPKWMSLEQLCRLAPVSKSTGESLAAGVLFGPLLAAVPFLIAASRLFPHAWVLPQSAELLYGRAPLLDSLAIPSDITLLGFFGFAVPALERGIRYRWLRWCIFLPLGTVFFAERIRVVSGPLAAPLAAGLLTLALFWFVWTRFDLLAVLVVQLAANLTMSSFILGQRRGQIWPFIATLACLLLAAFWFHRRGEVIVEGDPRSTVPALLVFRAEREKLQAEFSLARRAQQDMLPPTPEIAGYSLAASCKPSLEVGGDLYDFLKLSDGRVGIGVADVSGKGVPAALYMTLTKGLLASVTQDSAELIPVVEEVNRHLHSVTRKKVFVTMALGFLDVEERLLQYVRAGHNPIVWRQAALDATTLVSPGGIGLGITAGRVFSNQLKMEEMALSEGDAVVFYSDGVTEAMNGGLELFGEERLMSAVKKTDGLNAADARDSILGEVERFLGGIHPQDDMTLVVLRVGSRENLATNGGA